MTSPSADFVIQLEIFHSEAESAIKCAYAWGAIHAVAAKDKTIVRLLSQAPTFWKTNLDALQASLFVTLNRIFETKNNPHSVGRLLHFASSNLDIFSKTELASRKGMNPANLEEWESNYLQNAYEPTNDDFKCMKSLVAVRRNIYQAKYKNLRNKVYAHREVATQFEVVQLLEKTDTEEVLKMVVFLGSIYDDLWQLYTNGRKPMLTSEFFSVDSILEQPSPDASRRNLQERLVHEIKDFLERHAKVA
jgi:AbiU2